MTSLVDRQLHGIEKEEGAFERKDLEPEMNQVRRSWLSSELVDTVGSFPTHRSYVGVTRAT